MLAHAHSEYPNECCGFLAGANGEATHHLPLINALASPIAYEVAPRDLLAAHRAMWDLGIAEVAVYHSHPTSAPIPSDTDLLRNGYGETIPHIIIGAGNEVRAWRLKESNFEEIAWEVADG